MEKSEEKKQNNRKVDEKRHPDSKEKTTPNEKEWDPDQRGKEATLNDQEKLEALKNIRKPKDSDND